MLPAMLNSPATSVPLPSAVSGSDVTTSPRNDPAAGCLRDGHERRNHLPGPARNSQLLRGRAQRRHADQTGADDPEACHHTVGSGQRLAVQQLRPLPSVVCGAGVVWRGRCQWTGRADPLEPAGGPGGAGTGGGSDHNGGLGTGGRPLQWRGTPPLLGVQSAFSSV